jgi:regulator of sirC expression with transglutaminase-like and TPR domain
MMRYLHGRGLFFQKKIREAAEELERAVELDPEMVEAYYELGGVYLLLKQNAPASRALKRFLELSPGDRRAPPVRALLKKISSGGDAP